MRRSSILAEADPITHGLIAQVQDLNYDESQAEKEAIAARNTTVRPAATKKIVTARTIDFTAINRQDASDAKEFEEDSEEEAPEEPTTRHSKRLIKKDVNDSGPSNKK